MSIENIKIPLYFGNSIDRAIQEDITRYAENLRESPRPTNNPWLTTSIATVTNVDPAWTARLSNFDQMIREAASHWNTLTTPQVIQQTKNPDIQIPEQPTNPEEWMDLLK